MTRASTPILSRQQLKEIGMKQWFITGASSGFGRALAERVLAQGDRVIGTFRRPEDLRLFERMAPERSHGVLLDVRHHGDAGTTVRGIEERLGPIDVLVNNAGYGVQGAIETTPMHIVRDQFDVNVFGLVAVTQSVLPFMRGRRRGHIVNIASIGGLAAFPGVGIYNGSKFAVVGMSEALAKEVAPLGIRVTVVEPGAFRTDWAGRSMVHVEDEPEDYRTTVGARREAMAARNGRQVGDPARAADAIILAVQSERPPLHLVLGSDALRAAGEKLGSLQAELLSWAAVSTSTDFQDQSARELGL